MVQTRLWGRGLTFIEVEDSFASLVFAIVVVGFEGCLV